MANDAINASTAAETSSVGRVRTVSATASRRRLATTIAIRSTASSVSPSSITISPSSRTACLVPGTDTGRGSGGGGTNDPASVRAKITAKTRAILPVHIFGYPSEMGEIMDLAKKHKLAVIEDCAQSFGALHDGKVVGSIGDTGSFSFYPTKVLGCYGDGGMVTTNSDAVNEHIRRLRKALTSTGHDRLIQTVRGAGYRFSARN